MVEMFWEEKEPVFCAFIANICPENKVNILKFKIQQRQNIKQPKMKINNKEGIV